MPVYEFRCKVCGKVFEQFNTLGDFCRYAGCNCMGMAEIQLAKTVVDTWEPYYDKFQGKYFGTKGDFKKYCRSKGLDRMSGHQAKLHREESAELAYEEQRNLRDKN